MTISRRNFLKVAGATGGAPRPWWRSSRSHSRRATWMPASRSEELPLRSGADVVKVRQRVRTWAAELGFSLVDQTKLVTGASELARRAGWALERAARRLGRRAP